MPTNRVCQTVIDPIEGDCERAAIASLLRVPLDDVPYWPDDKDYHSNQKQWLDERGYGMIECYRDPTHGWPFRLTVLDETECIASVPSQLFEGKSHAILARFDLADNGAIALTPVHDPNPKNVPYPNDIISVATWVTFILPRTFAEGQ